MRLIDMICKSDTVGVFQIESRAQMAMLPRLKPKNFYDLVIEISIVRPGPITGGMVHPYLRRRQGKEEAKSPHPLLDTVLKKTLGVPLFQEQVMKLAMVVADYTPGEADQLRRDMAAWHRSGRMERHHEKLITRMQAKGIAAEFAERIFQQIRGFGEYGFPESHAASFALIAYATAWLKCHYPAEFACSLLNAQPMGFYTPATIVEDAKRHQVIVRPLDAQVSAWDCVLERCVESAGGLAVRMGLRYVKGLGEREGERIARAREQKTFVSLEDFARRTGLDEGALCALAEAGAFDSFHIDRRTALWDARRLARTQKESLSLPGREQRPGFAPLSDFEEVGWDYRRTAHSPRRHPLEPMRPSLMRLWPARRARRSSDERWREDSLCRSSDLPPTARHRGRRRIHDSRRRNRFRQHRRVGKRLSALFGPGEDGELSRYYRQTPSRRRRGASGCGRIVGTESGTETGERAQPGFSLKL